MKKTQHTINLTGYTSAGVPANTHEGDQVTLFRNDKDSVRVTKITKDAVKVSTALGVYELPVSSYDTKVYKGVMGDDIKAHFTKKVLVAKLIYWA